MGQIGHIDTLTSDSLDQEGKYPSFFQNKEEYGVGILKIKEIIEPMPITSVPRTPEYILGMAKIEESVKILLDIDKALGKEELGGW